jgi:hypothetical protein
MKNEEIVSINRAAVTLNRDRRTIARALRDVSPDGEEGGHPRWHLTRIKTALARHDRLVGSHRSRADNDEALLVAADEIEAAATGVDAFLKELQSEKSLLSRREIARRDGRVIGRFETALSVAADIVPEHERCLHEHYADSVMRDLISAANALCGWKLEGQNNENHIRANSRNHPPHRRGS